MVTMMLVSKWVGSMRFAFEEVRGAAVVAKCHVRLQATICICNYPKCNDWSTNGTVTTNVPVTDGSGVLCYRGTADNYEATYCKKNETMCAYLGVDGGSQLVISSFEQCIL